MSALRHSVMEKSLKKSLHVYRQKNNIADQSDISDLDLINRSRDTPGLPSKSCARTRLRKRKAGSKGKENLAKKEKDIHENATVQHGVNKIIEVLETDILHDKSNSQHGLDGCSHVESSKLCEMKSAFAKLSRQELVDIATEYQFKYERLLSQVDQFKMELMSTHSVLNERIKLADDMKKQLQEHLYTLEEDKFRSEEQVQNLTEENNKLNTALAEQEQKILSDCSKNRIPENLHQSLMQQQSPRAVSRMKRRSMINQTLVTLASKNESRSKEDLYEDVIIDQQDILDFYSLLCGVSVWKDKSSGGEEEEEIKDDQEREATNLAFQCKIQMPYTQFDDEGFNMTLDFESKQIAVSKPILEVPEKSSSDEVKQSSVLTKLSKYDADEGYLFLKELLNSVPNSM